MASSRPIRIARRSVASPTPGLPPLVHGGTFVENTAGRTRAVRLFSLYAVLLAAVYLAFLGVVLAAPSSAARDDPVTIAALSLVAVALALWGYLITLARTPRGVRFQGAEILVVERPGRTRRFVAPPSLELRVVYRFGPGILAREPTELVEVTSVDGRRCTYLVAQGLLSGGLSP